MKIEVDTEIEEISELKAALAILEDAINRRENVNQEEEEESKDYKEATKTFIQPEPAQQPEPSQQASFEQPETKPEPAPEVDMSALSQSDYGEKIENRTMENIPQQDNKSIVKEIITDLAKNVPNQPIQMSDIVSKASEKNIKDEETRKLVDELKDSGEI